MKSWRQRVILATFAGLNACAMMPFGAGPVAHKVSVNGENYSLNQLTASTWTAISTGPAKALATTAAMTAGLRQAVETTSGCKVTDSDYSQRGKQFDAQVDCGGMVR